MKTEKVSFKVNKDLFLNLLPFTKKDINNYFKTQFTGASYAFIKSHPSSIKNIVFKHFYLKTQYLDLPEELLNECLNQLKEYISKRYDHYLMTRFMKGEK